MNVTCCIYPPSLGNTNLGDDSIEYVISIINECPLEWLRLVIVYLSMYVLMVNLYWVCGEHQLKLLNAAC